MAVNGIWQWLSAALLFSCLASFTWAMHRFFVQPAGSTVGMRIISASGVLSAALHFGAILSSRSITWQRGSIGALLYACALGLFWWAIRANSGPRLSAAFSPDTPVHLVKDGPYRFIRHPFYCSYLLAWAAGFVATGRLWLIPTLAVMLVIYLRAALLEERKFSRSSLADEYRSYRSRTAWLVPNPLKLMLARRLL